MALHPTGLQSECGLVDRSAWQAGPSCSGEEPSRCRNSRVTRPPLKQKPFLPQTLAQQIPTARPKPASSCPGQPPACLVLPRGPRRGSLRSARSAALCPAAPRPGQLVGMGRLPLLHAHTLPSSMFPTPGLQSPGSVLAAQSRNLGEGGMGATAELPSDFAQQTPELGTPV